MSRARTPRNRSWPAAALVSAALSIAVSLIGPCRLGAEETVLHLFRSDEPDRRLEHVLYLAAGVELTKAGLSSTRDKNDPDYVLLTEYAAADGTTEIRYTLTGALTGDDASGRRPAVLRFRLPVDHDLDMRIAAQIRLIVAMAGVRISPSPDATIEGLLPESVPTGAGSERGSAESTAPGFWHRDSDAGPGSRKGRPAGKASIVRFDSSVSTAGVVLFGDVTDFFHYGVAGVITLGAVWPWEAWSLALGARASLIRVFNDDGVTGGPLYLSTAGADLQLGTGTNRSYRLAAGTSAGAAMITVAGGETMTKTVPYVDIGLRAAIPLGRRFFLGGEGRFLMVFDGDLLIMGASPALTLGMEL